MVSKEATQTTSTTKSSSLRLLPPALALIVCSILSLAFRGWFSAAPDVLVADNLHMGDAFLEDKQVAWRIRLTNKGGEDLKITSFATSCTCLAVEPKSATVPAGGSKEIDLKIDLTRLSPAADGSQEEFGVAFVPVSAQLPIGFRGWLVRGRLRRFFVVDPPRLYLGEVPLNEKIAPLQFKVRANAPVRRVWGECDPVIASVENRSVDHSVSLVSVSPKPISTPGRAEIAVDFFAEDQEGKVRNGTYLIEGTVLDEVELSPNRLFLGAKPVGESVSTTISIRSRNREGQIDASIIVESPPGAIGKSVREDRGVNLTVQIPIEKSGPTNGSLKLSILIEGRQAPIYRVLDVVYRGLAH